MTTSSAPADDGPAHRGRPRDPRVDRAVLEAVVDVLGSGGVEALTVEAVAQQAGVSRASVYRRYSSRTELLDAACREFAPNTPEPPDTGSVRSDLIQLMGRFRENFTGTDTGRLFPFMIGAAGTNDEVRAAIRRFKNSRGSPTVAVLRQGIERGELRDDVDADLVADLLLGAVMFRTVVRGDPVDDRRVESMVDTVLAGILRPDHTAAAATP